MHTTTIQAAPKGPHDRLLDSLRAFVHRERAASQERLLDIWNQPLSDKLAKGLTQRFLRLERGPEAGTLWAVPDHGESRFREGDLLRLHLGSPLASALAGEVMLEQEQEDRWLLRSKNAAALVQAVEDVTCYADPDDFDLTKYYDQVFNEIGESLPPSRAYRKVLPLLAGEFANDFDARDFEDAERVALAEGLNLHQAEAVGKAVAAHQVACIQGPPGTGKTRVLALVARLLVARGERVLVTSHTHTAINHALNKIAALGVPLAKVGRQTQAAALDPAIASVGSFGEWHARPQQGGYVVGATPFATCTSRLDKCEFDTIIFDEASQVTLPLALMAMRRGERFVFIGDQKQLPPVVQSKSILDKEQHSVFQRLTSANAEGVMLTETYRMNRDLTQWPSTAFYGGKLQSAGPNRDRKLALLPRANPDRFDAILRDEASAIFIPTRDHTARSRNKQDAALVAGLCAAALAGGLAPGQLGVVSPYRAHGRTVRTLLAEQLGWDNARRIVADTVERMQGQERELIILTLASGDLAFLGTIAGFFFQSERLNVSVTRAMTKLVIIGPDLPPDFGTGHDELARMVGLYRSMVGQARRVDW